jgi:hypothetical protein
VDNWSNGRIYILHEAPVDSSSDNEGSEASHEEEEMKQQKLKTTPKKDVITTRRDPRYKSESDILHQVRNEVQDALLRHAPLKWPDECLEVIEEKVLDHTKMILAALSTNELRSPGALRTHITQAVAQTKRLIRNVRVELNGGGK